MKFCPNDDMYLFSDVIKTGKLLRMCKLCGYSEDDTQGGLVMETRIQQRAGEGYKLLNEFTTQDPTLPHVKNIKCPTEACESNTGTKERDVIYIKYDPVNLKYLYVCMTCSTRWRSR
jgi:DNA-directed RNA polymerase subunit M/transcription elongation factor TFIIS